MKLTLEQNGSIMTVEHGNGVTTHNPDLLDFARYCEDIFHKLTFLDDIYSIRFVIKGESKFSAFTTSESMSRILYNYFTGGHYALDLGFDEVTRLFCVESIEYKT